MRFIKPTPYYSLRIGGLPKGCQYCVKGKKLVLFVTGICSNSCFYCPISEKKKNKDVVYANEWPTHKIENIIQEAKLCSSEGAGITGGDPLTRLERTCFYIRELKKHFGSGFHVHLYTPLKLVTKDNLKQLKNAGLDELRFHPDLDSQELWSNMNYLIEGLDYGVEIPVFPDKKMQTQKLIDFLAGLSLIKFLNLNELESSDTNELGTHGYEVKDDYSTGIEGSEDMGIELMEYCLENTNLRVHYCTTTLKDSVQMAKRIKRRAKNVKLSFEKLNEQGLLKRHAVYLPELKPGFSYTTKLLTVKDKGKVLGKLVKLKEKLDCEKVEIDKANYRLLMDKETILSNKKWLKQEGFVPANVIEYPTYDKFIAELEFL